MSNFRNEMARIDSRLGTYNMIAFDMEFPGFLRNTPREASEEARYRDLKFNVDRLKPIQLGLTVFNNEGRIGGSWQFNFNDFDVTNDLQVGASIQLLRSNGINLEKNRLEGVDSRLFAFRLKEILANHGVIKWVTFHGLYDLGYLLRMLTQTYTPDSVVEFAKKVGEVLGSVYDVKFMAKYCNGLMDGLLGLEKLSKILMVERVGAAHQAGSDSLLTARVFLKMVKVYGLVRQAFEGFLFGIGTMIENKVNVLVVFDSPSYYYPCFKSHNYAVPMGHGASQVNPWYHHQSVRVLPRPLLSISLIMCRPVS